MQPLSRGKCRRKSSELEKCWIYNVWVREREREREREWIMDGQEKFHLVKNLMR